LRGRARRRASARPHARARERFRDGAAALRDRESPERAVMRRPPSDGPPETAEDLTSRSDVKRANRVVEETLAELSLRLFDLAKPKLAALELPEGVYETVLEAQAMKNPRARKRQLGLVRVALRNADWAVIQERVRYLAEGRAVPPPNAEGEGPAEG